MARFSTNADSPGYDVIVVGGGGSGLAAALTAAEHGGRVLVVEKCRQLGGTTGIAVGSFTASGTSLQRKAGIEDDVAAHVDDVAKFAPPEIEASNNGELRRFFLSQAAGTFVLDTRGRPIPGLYAAGQNGLGGMVLWGHGLHIAWALTSGRLAGKAVMESD